MRRKCKLWINHLYTLLQKIFVCSMNRTSLVVNDLLPSQKSGFACCAGILRLYWFRILLPN